MKRMATAFLLLALVLLLPAASPARAGTVAQVRLDLVEWETISGIIPCIRIHSRWANPDPASPNLPVSVQMHTQPFGAFVPNGRLIHAYDVPQMEPASFFDVFLDIPLSDLPPSAERIVPGGGAGTDSPATASCPPDNFWAGNIDVLWTGPGGSGQVNVHNGTLQICPNGSPSYIHVVMDCNSSTGINWSFGPLCAGWSASLVYNNGFTPGDPAPNPIPQGPFDGWICISANNTVPVGSNCNLVMNLNCGSEPATISVLAEACDWQVTPVSPASWSDVKVHFGN